MATIILQPSSSSENLQIAINNAVPGVNTIIVVSSDIVFTGVVIVPADRIITLVADGNWTLIGSSGNAFTVNGILNLGEENPSFNGNLTITGFTNSAIRVTSGGIFTMYGGVISGNMSESGGGVSIIGGTFNMAAGLISNNIAGIGGGVHVCQVSTNIFNMTGGIISGNEATNGSVGGGGVAMFGGEFNMSGDASIENNIVSGSGGGIYISLSISSFNMNGNARIANNEAVFLGGGIVSLSGASTNIYGGEISGNTARSGGGISVSLGSVGVYGGEIADNGAKNGGGIWVDETATADISGNSVIINNNAVNGNGGGIYNLGSVGISGNAEISNNRATYDGNGQGGGIYTDDFNRLTVIGPRVKFANNRADFATEREPANDAVYATHILNMEGNWTVPFQQGYNNFDINQNGTRIEPEDDCLKIILLLLIMFCRPKKRCCCKKYW